MNNMSRRYPNPPPAKMATATFEGHDMTTERPMSEKNTMTQEIARRNLQIEISSELSSATDYPLISK